MKTLIEVVLPTGHTERWSLEYDKASGFNISDTNVLVIYDENESMLCAYSPVGWVSAKLV